jgi:RNA polymerase sigma factor (sigma-70 family)
MDFEDEAVRSGTIGDADALPPSDWDGFGRNARMEALYTAHRPRLTSFFRNRAPGQDVGDLVQEVFSRFAATGSFAASLIERPSAYLFRAARNLLTEHARADERHFRSHHDSFDESASGTVDPHDALEARDALRRAEEAIAGLSPLTREIFLLQRIDHMSYPEIARLKGLSVKTIESHMSKALAALRRSRGTR